MAGKEVAFQKPVTTGKMSADIIMHSVVITEPTTALEKALKVRNTWTDKQKKILLGAMSASSTEHVRWLTLNYGNALDGRLLRLKKSWTLRFVISGTLASVKVRLFTNHPLEDGGERVFRELAYDEKPAISGLLFADIVIKSAGSFQYFFTVDGSNREDKARGFGRFIVDPELKVGKALKHIPIDGITCQTVLSKNLGPFSTWMKRLMVAKKSGYNAIHFTPVQELGASGSAYALQDLFRLNPSFGPGITMTDVGGLVNCLCEDHGVLSFTDLVLNHAANESEWLATRPHCVYNVSNSPHLRPAFLLDCALARFSAEIERGQWSEAGIPAWIQTEAHLDAIGRVLHEQVIAKLCLWEFFQMDAEKTICKIRDWVDLNGTLDVSSPIGQLYRLFTGESEFKRFDATVDVNLAARLYGRFGAVAYDNLRQKLHHMNHETFCVTKGHINAAVSNVIAQARYRFVDPKGLRLGRVTFEEPLVHRYFRMPLDYDGQSIAEDETLMYSDQARFCWAHSGWVDIVNFDPLRNFADLDSDVYIRRELNPWTDSVKLRYGSSPSDCPELWDHVLEYAKLTARTFHGIRLDNCHSTSIAVAEFVVNGARSVRPDLFVFAELYAGTGPLTTTRASRLGINAVVESAMNLSQPRQLAERLTLSGGRPLGAFIARTVDPLVPCRLPIMFFDQTHDDPSPLERRSVFDVLPTSALIAACASPVGSNRGYDEVVPRRISVMTETRLYRPWIWVDATSPLPSAPPQNEVPEYVDYNTGIIRAKRALNELHCQLADSGYEQIRAEVIEDDVIAMTRYSSALRRFSVIIAHSAFERSNDLVNRPIRNLELPGMVVGIVLEGSVTCRSQLSDEHPTFISGLQAYSAYVQENIDKVDSFAVRVVPTAGAASGYETLEFKSFRQGSIIALDVKLTEDAELAVGRLEQLVTYFDCLIWNIPLQVTDVGVSNEAIVKQLKTIVAEPVIAGTSKHGSASIGSAQSASVMRSFGQLLEAVSRLSVEDVHFVLYESVDSTDDPGTAYHLPGYGDLGHCGLASLVPIFDEIHFNDGDPCHHPLGRNLRDGDWLMDYMSSRLVANPKTRQLGGWFVDTFEVVKKLPRFLVPRYFEAVVAGVFSLVSMQV